EKCPGPARAVASGSMVREQLVVVAGRHRPAEDGPGDSCRQVTALGQAGSGPAVRCLSDAGLRHTIYDIHAAPASVTRTPAARPPKARLPMEPPPAPTCSAWRSAISSPPPGSKATEWSPRWEAKR